MRSKLTIIVSLFVGVPSFADTVQNMGDCKSVEQCQKLHKELDEKIEKRILILNRSAAAVGDFLRYKNGTIAPIATYADADANCKNLGTRLPTIRELAVDASSYGAGYMETEDYETNKNYPTNYNNAAMNPIEGINKNTGAPDAFYYSNEHYQKPTSDIAVKKVWSSTNDKYGRGIYVLDGPSGYPEIVKGFAPEEPQDQSLAVRCVKKDPSSR